jgi:hypothetical protein
MAAAVLHSNSPAWYNKRSSGVKFGIVYHFNEQIITEQLAGTDNY